MAYRIALHIVLFLWVKFVLNFCLYIQNIIFRWILLSIRFSLKRSANGYSFYHPGAIFTEPAVIQSDTVTHIHIPITILKTQNVTTQHDYAN